MATYKITAQNQEIDFAPESEVIEVLQNVRMILCTVMQTVPLDREFGIAADYLDKPLPVAQARLNAKIYDAIKKFEPRAQILEITYTGDNATGKLIPNVKVSITKNRK